MNIIIILPTQVFDFKYYKKIINKNDIVFIIEDKYFFSKYKFHKQKLLLHQLPKEMSTLQLFF